MSPHRHGSIIWMSRGWTFSSWKYSFHRQNSFSKEWFLKLEFGYWSLVLGRWCHIGTLWFWKWKRKCNTTCNTTLLFAKANITGRLYQYNRIPIIHRINFQCFEKWILCINNNNLLNIAYTVKQAFLILWNPMFLFETIPSIMIYH